MTSDQTTSGTGTPRVLVAVPQGPMRERLLALLRERDVRVDSAPASVDLLDAVADAASADLVVMRRQDLTAADRDRLDRLARRDGAPDVVVVGPDLDEAARVDLVSAGAADVIDAADLDVRAAESLEALATGPGGHATPEGPQPSLADFSSRSKAMHALLDLVQRIAPTDSTLLITGETGVGKEHLARAIHAASPRASGPFLAVNCAALPENLLESELFGHAAGAFTGADRARKGYFQASDGGTLLLDEIGEMPTHLQVKLLRVLQRGEVRPLGTDDDVRVDVRVMAATNRDLHALVEAGSFREDLYYRLNVVDLAVPPLRERVEDLPTMIGALLRHFRERLGRPHVDAVDDAALDALLRHAWPGNVRELIHVLERATLVARENRIRLSDLPAAVVSAEPTAGGATSPWGADGMPPALGDLPWKEARAAVLEAAERAYLHAALERCRGVVGATAKHAGLSPRSLYDKMKAHGLRKEDYRRRRR